VAAADKDVLRREEFEKAETEREGLLDQTLIEYEEVVVIVSSKVKELERLVKLKDHRIEDLLRKCKDNNIAVANR
jgi:translation elongation factor EF-Tu-like GTPase